MLGDRFAGNSAIFSLDVTLPAAIGQSCPTLPMAGVSAVGVHPTHRRRGFLRQLMRAMHDDARERGEPLAGLEASESSIYGRFGYGLAANLAEYSIDSRASAFAVTPPDIDDLVGGQSRSHQRAAGDIRPTTTDESRRGQSESGLLDPVPGRRLAQPEGTLRPLPCACATRATCCTGPPVTPTCSGGTGRDRRRGTPWRHPGHRGRTLAIRARSGSCPSGHLHALRGG